MKKVETAYICDRCKETVEFDDARIDPVKQVQRLTKKGWRRVNYGNIDALSHVNVGMGFVVDLCPNCAGYVASALEPVSQSNEAKV